MITEAFFMAAEDPDAWRLIDQFVKAKPEWPLLPVIDARALLFQDRLDPARDEILRVLQGDPTNPYALAVMAEIHLRSGEIAEADQILQKELQQPSELPQWLNDHLQRLSSRS